MFIIHLGFGKGRQDLCYRDSQDFRGLPDLQDSLDSQGFQDLRDSPDLPDS